MIRRSSRFGLLFALVVSGVGTAYGCGGGGDDSPGDPGGEGGSADDAGSVTLADGAIVLSDGAATSDGASDAARDTGADAFVPPVGPLSADYVDYDINHVIMTGQSNALANTGTAPRVTTAYSNQMFIGGPTVGATPASFVLLAAGDSGREALGMADLISKLALDTFEFGVKAGYPTKHELLISNNSRSGWTYWCLRKGGCNYKPGTVPFADAMGQVAQGKALAGNDGKSFVVRAVTNIHGESEHTSYRVGDPEFPLTGTDGVSTIADYADGLVEWQRDYEAEVKAITGQAQPVPMFITQLSGWNDIQQSQIPQFQYVAHKRALGKVVIIGASYPMQFFDDCRHFTGASRRWLGEYFAKVYARVVFQGQRWEPVRPMSITRAGNIVTVKYFVPVPPLVLDTVRITNPGQFGFDFTNDGAAVAITNVVVSGQDTVVLTLASTPAGAVKKLRYAQNQIPFTCQGSGSNTGGPPGARGNLRDSDATVSRHGFELQNWGIVFEEDVP